MSMFTWYRPAGVDMSLTRQQLITIYKNAKHIHTQSQLPDVRRKAREIAVLVEQVVGQQDGLEASQWKD